MVCGENQVIPFPAKRRNGLRGLFHFFMFICFFLGGFPVLAEVKGGIRLTIDPTRRLVIEIDSASRCQPSEWALKEAISQLKEWMPGREIVVAPVQRIPENRWPRSWSETETARLAQDFLDNLPDDSQEVVYIQWVPDEPQKDSWGTITDEILVKRSGNWYLIPGVVLFCDALPPERTSGSFWGKMEKLILAHEIGHLLELPKDAKHINRKNLDHCSKKSCLMAGFTGSVARYLAVRFLHRFLPSELCSDCRKDLIDMENGRFSKLATPERKKVWEKEKRSANNQIAAQILAGRGQFQEGLALLRQGIQETPDDLGQRGLLAELLFRENQAEDGWAELREILARNSSDKEKCASNPGLEHALLQKGFYKAAGKVYENCPGNRLVFSGNDSSAVWVELANGRLEKALFAQQEYAEKTVLPDGYDSMAWQDAALLSSWASDDKRTEKLLEKVDNYYIVDLYWIQTRFLRRADPSGKQADRFLEKAIRMHTKERETYGSKYQNNSVRLALLLIERGDQDQARKLLETVKPEECGTVFSWACRRYMALGWARVNDEAQRDLWLGLISHATPQHFKDDPCLDVELRSVVPEATFRRFFPRCWAEERDVPERKTEPAPLRTESGLKSQERPTEPERRAPPTGK